MRASWYPLLVITACLWCLSAEEDESSAKSDSILEKFFVWKFRHQPLARATYLGARQILPDRSLEAINNWSKDCEEFAREAEAESRNNGKDRHFLRSIFREASACVKAVVHKSYVFAAIDFISGLQVSFPRHLRQKQHTSFGSLWDYQALLQVMQETPDYVEQLKHLLSIGIDRRVTYANDSLVRTLRQLGRLQVSAEASDFFLPFKFIPHLSRAEEVQILQGRAINVIEQSVMPALKELEQFIRAKYMPNARPDPGIWSVPDGRALYEATLEFYSSGGGVGGQEVHEMGLQHVADCQAKIRIVAESLGHRGNTVEIMRRIENLPDQVFSSRQEALQAIRHKLWTDIRPTLNQVFHEEDVEAAASAGLEVAPLPEEWNEIRGAAHYCPSNKEKGKLLVDLTHMESLKRFEVTAACLEMGLPGRHLQAMFNVQLPRFLAAFPDEHLAHVRGWAAYSQSLGLELGLYRDPYSLIGYFAACLVRSARLVVDSGIHKLAWSRQRAVDYLVTASGLEAEEAELEVDWCITRPGEAVAEVIGLTQMRDLRRRKESESGRNFDLRRFHSNLLACYGPMDDLDECYDHQEMLLTAAQGTNGSRIDVLNFLLLLSLLFALPLLSTSNSGQGKV